MPPIIGCCAICGKVGPLTKEHIPPKSSLGSLAAGMVVQNADAYFAHRRGRPYQNGYWAPVLCESCNRQTGSWYGTAFGQWSRWGIDIARAVQSGGPVPPPVFRGYPLRILKQVLTTMAAASLGRLIAHRPDLREAILEPEKPLAQPVDLAIFLCGSRSGRTTGVAVARAGDKKHVLCEFALPPFGYVLTLEGTPLDSRPLDIGSWAQFGYDDQVDMNLDGLQILPTHEAFPGDYRTRDQIRHDAIVSMLTEEDHPDPPSEAKRILAVGEGPAFFEAHDEQW